ncbi:hypothetical protein [Streptomyces sp. NPDC005423]|uniref:hypothetical protein n=1 Tax=Streptomyces sp. NPDC005423 TaxID=3155343 RepID=UPI0033B155A0
MNEPSLPEEVRRRRIDLSMAQVAGSAVAAVTAAKLASYFGVYGTILGAGVVSVIATCGGTVFQHFFRRTGEQLRETKASAGPRKREEQRPPALGEFNEATVHRARVRSWKRPVLAAALVFGVALAGITTFELVSGDSFSGGTSTTVGAALTGRAGSSSAPATDSPSPAASTPTPAATGTPSGGTLPSPASTGPDTGGGTASSPAPTPGAGTEGAQGTGSGGAATPSATPSAPASDPAPSAGSRSGTADPGPADPVAP